MRSKNIKKIALLFASIVAITALFEISGLRENFSLEFLRALIEANLVLGITLFIVMFAIGNLIQIPGWVFLAAAVLALGKINGGLVTYMAAVTSCLFTYGLVGVLGHSALRGLENPVAQKIFKQLDQHPVACVFGLRLIFQTLPIVNYALALSRLKFKHYLIGTLLGLPIPIFLYCWFFEFLAVHVFHISV